MLSDIEFYSLEYEKCQRKLNAGISGKLRRLYEYLSVAMLKALKSAERN